MPLRAFGRAKRVTYPLDDKAKARLRGDDEHCPRAAGCTSSSRREHDAADLSGLVCGLFFPSSDGEQGEAEGDERPSGDDDDPSKGQCSFYGALPSAGMIRELVRPRATSPAEDRFRRVLEADVEAAAGRFAGMRPRPASFRRAVMGSLREIGYNAGICKSRWEGAGGGLVAGTYEYIDVLVPATTAAPPCRYVVDVDFAGEFEIARPTAEYRKLAAELPAVFVGRPEGLRRLLGVLAEAARRSLLSRGMPVPPWRKSRYMQAKWLGPYRRTVDPGPPSPPSAGEAATPSAASFGPGRGDANCRFVGFDAASPPVAPPAESTR